MGENMIQGNPELLASDVMPLLLGIPQAEAHIMMIHCVRSLEERSLSDKVWIHALQAHGESLEQPNPPYCEPDS